MLKVCAENKGGKVTFRFDGTAENLSILLRNVDGVSRLSGAEAEKTELGTLLKVNVGLEDVSFTL